MCRCCTLGGVGGGGFRGNILLPLFKSARKWDQFYAKFKLLTLNRVKEFNNIFHTMPSVNNFSCRPNSILPTHQTAANPTSTKVVLCTRQTLWTEGEAHGSLEQCCWAVLRIVDIHLPSGSQNIQRFNIDIYDHGSQTIKKSQWTCQRTTGS
jgi:hypothetical protein